MTDKLTQGPRVGTIQPDDKNPREQFQIFAGYGWVTLEGDRFAREHIGQIVDAVREDEYKRCMKKRIRFAAYSGLFFGVLFWFVGLATGAFFGWWSAPFMVHGVTR